MSAKQIIRDLTPPVLWRGMRTARTAAPAKADGIVFRGDYSSWDEAEKASTRYDAPEILEKTRAAMLKMRNGEAVAERDSVVFDKAEYSFPLLAGLLRATAGFGRLSVLDFGGALGSTYFQNRTFLSAVKELRWSVVEQPAHVACGRAEFTSNELCFYPTIDECLSVERPDVLLLSGVVQYLPNPYDFLLDVLRHGFSYVIVDRTAFMRNGTARLTVQHVPEWIYRASYPAWFLSEQRFIECFEPRYKLIASFPALDATQPEGGEADYKGFIFELNHEHEQR